MAKQTTNPLRCKIREFTYEEFLALKPKWEHLVLNANRLVDDETGQPVGQRYCVEHGLSYVGRKMPGRFPMGSRFGNPLPLPAKATAADREANLRKYLQRALAPGNLRMQIPMLKGRRLVCWCAPQLCHGHLLAVLANELPGPDPKFVEAALARLQIHLVAANFEMAEQTCRSLAEEFTELHLPQPELSGEERGALSLEELGLDERTIGSLEKAEILTAGQLAAYYVSGRPWPRQIGPEAVGRIRAVLRELKVLS